MIRAFISYVDEDIVQKFNCSLANKPKERRKIGKNEVGM